MKIVMKVVMLMAAVAMSATANAQQQYTATDQWTVGHGDYILTEGVPGCGQQSINLVAEAGQAIAASQQGGIYGSLASVLESAAKYARPGMGGFAGQMLDVIFGGDRFANCVPVSVLLSGWSADNAGQSTGRGWYRYGGMHWRSGLPHRMVPLRWLSDFVCRTRKGDYESVQELERRQNANGDDDRGLHVLRKYQLAFCSA